MVGSLNQSRFNAEQRAQHHVDFTEALVKQPFENQNRDERRHGVRQNQQHAVNRFALQGLPLHEAGQHHAHGHGQDHGQHREDHRPDEDGEERFLDAFVGKHADKVVPADGDGIARAEFVIPQLPSAFTD